MVGHNVWAVLRGTAATWLSASRAMLGSDWQTRPALIVLWFDATGTALVCARNCGTDHTIVRVVYVPSHSLKTERRKMWPGPDVTLVEVEGVVGPGRTRRGPDAGGRAGGAA